MTLSRTLMRQKRNDEQNVLKIYLARLRSEWPAPWPQLPQLFPALGFWVIRFPRALRLRQAASYRAYPLWPALRLCFPYFIPALFAFLGPHPLSLPGASLSAKYFSAARVAEK